MGRARLMSGLLDVDEARHRLLDGLARLPAEILPIMTARSRVLAADVTALRSQPPFNAAAMDGYAIRWRERSGPWALAGTSAAGHGWDGILGHGEAVRIFTGAPLPADADTIVVQEDTSRDDNQIRLSGEGPPHQGAHVRLAGQDFATGSPIGRSGDLLTPARIALIAAGGHDSVAVVRRPRVTLIATGDELVPPGSLPGPNQIINSNSIMLAALFESVGAVVTDPGIVPDDATALAAALATADADLIITIGGASVGDHDLVVPVLRQLGATLDFWKIAMRPGKPMLAGRLGTTRVIGLPGNPVSAYVCALLFVLPWLARCAGRPEALPMRRVPLANPLAANGIRRDHLRARLVDGAADAFASQDSALLGRLASAQLLIVRPACAPAAATGDLVDCIALDSIGNVS
jgi:molybdopterin molybdotransferase